MESYKKKILAHPLCEICLKENKNDKVEEVHHILPLSSGGTNDEEILSVFVNLVIQRFMLSVEIDSDEKSFEGGGVVILKADSPYQRCRPLTHKKTGSKGVLKNIFPIRRKTHKFIVEVSLVFIKGIFLNLLKGISIGRLSLKFSL